MLKQIDFFFSYCYSNLSIFFGRKYVLNVDWKECTCTLKFFFFSTYFEKNFLYVLEVSVVFCFKFFFVSAINRHAIYGFLMEMKVVLLESKFLWFITISQPLGACEYEDSLDLLSKLHRLLRMGGVGSKYNKKPSKLDAALLFSSFIIHFILLTQFI